jgi:predicted negative regulator of RcsB-dependent stress response
MVPGLGGSPATPGTAAVGVNENPDLSKIVGPNGQISPLTIVLGAIMVLGGGAGWKFWSQRSKEAHELKLLEMEKTSKAASEDSKKVSEHEETISSLKKKVEDLEVTASKGAKASAAVVALEEKVDALEAKLKKALKTLEEKEGV